MKYKLITNNDKKEFELRVEDYLKIEYTLHGTTFSNSNFDYIQAMVLREEAVFPPFNIKTA